MSSAAPQVPITAPFGDFVAKSCAKSVFAMRKTSINLRPFDMSKNMFKVDVQFDAPHPIFALHLMFAPSNQKMLLESNFFVGEHVLTARFLAT